MYPIITCRSQIFYTQKGGIIIVFMVLVMTIVIDGDAASGGAPILLSVFNQFHTIPSFPPTSSWQLW